MSDKKISQLTEGTPLSGDIGVFVQGGVTKKFDFANLPIPSGVGDMETSVYDPANGAKQVAFEEDVVPYTGATQDVDLNTFKLNAQSIHAKGTGGAGHLGLKHQSSDITASTSESSLGANSDGNPVWKNDGNAIQKIMLENADITGATKTKITYDSKGLVIAGADATQDDIGDGTTYKQYSTTEKTKLAGIEEGAEVNNISDVNATDLTDGGDTTLHTHDGRYYTETEVDALLSGKEASITAGTTSQYWRGDKTFQTLDKTVVGLSNVDNTSDATKNSAAATLTNKNLTSVTNTFPTFNQNTTGEAGTVATINGKISAGTNITLSGTGTTASPYVISSTGGGAGYTDEQAQDAVGSILVDSSEIDFTYDDATPSITATLKSGSIDESKLDTSVNASLNLANSSVQPSSSPTLGTITTTGGIELGHASDTTLSRSSTGVLAVEGVVIPSISSTNTLTNKTMTGATNTLTASLLKSATTEINVSSATAPTTGQVLTATSPTTTTWQNPSGGGGGLSLLATQTLSSAATSISTGTFAAKNNLVLRIFIPSTNSTTNSNTAIRFNSDSGANYSYSNSTNGASAGFNTSSTFALLQNAISKPLANVDTTYITVNISNYTSFAKIGVTSSSYMYGNPATTINTDVGGFRWNNTSTQINSITVTTNGGTANFAVGTTIQVYGTD